MMWPWFNWGFGGIGGYGWIMFIFMIIFWGLVIWGIVALIRAAGHREYHNPDRPDSAMEILKRRYAAGEITREEYEEKKRGIQ